MTLPTGPVTAQPNRKDQPPTTSVIPRPKAVGISWYNVRIGTQYQEIATPRWGSQ